MRIKNYTNKEYIREKRRFIQEYDPWFEDYWSKKSNIWSFKYREYRSWKYNRKT
jgi:hypothetical protein